MAEPAVVCAGMCVADILVQGISKVPRTGETGFISDIAFAVGGDAVNQAVALTKLGDHVAVLGMVGQDMPGDFIRRELAGRGINVDGIVVDGGRPTHSAVVLIDGAGERSFMIRKPEAAILTGPEHINTDLVRPGVKAVAIGSLFCAPRFDHEAVLPLLRKARAVGAITFADMVMDQRGYGLDDLREIWPLLDYAMPSELEGELLTGKKDPQGIAKAFQQRGVKNVVVKLGSEGVLAFIGDEVFASPAFHVPVVDTTGAGDNFVGGFIHAMLRGLPVPDVLRFASACAALSIGAVGAGAGMEGLAQVEAFLRDRT